MPLWLANVEGEVLRGVGRESCDWSETTRGPQSSVGGAPKLIPYGGGPGCLQEVESRMVGNWGLIIPNKILCLLDSTGDEQGVGSFAAL